jgi:CxxC-x17-CxxC domain-containing protein
MEYQDKNMVCVDCHKSFVWTAGDQEFYATKGFTNAPKRCKECKATQGDRPSRGRSGFSRDRQHERIETVAKCAQCGKQTTVPFKPSGDRPVYCKECFAQRRR